MKEEYEAIPKYVITDDIFSLALEIAERIEQLPLAGMKKREFGEVPKASFRRKGAGIFLGEQLIGRAPIPQTLEKRLKELEHWLVGSNAHPLIKAGMVVHQYIAVQFYEEDNMCYGMRRAESILAEWKKQCAGICLDEALDEREMVVAFEQCDLYGEVGPFIRFFLKAVYQTVGAGGETREIQRLLECMGEEAYTTRELMERVGLKHRPTFRDKYLLPAMSQGLVEMTIPDKPNSSQQRYRKV